MPKKRLSTEVYPPPSKKIKLIHDDLIHHNANPNKVFTFCYHPITPSHTGPQGLITNKITALYQAISPVRLDLILTIKRNQPTSIQQLAKALNRDYAAVWRDISALEKLGLVKLRKMKKGKAIKPVIFVEKLIIEILLAN
ncbi:HTH domain-containing protein [endosymbiont GvMRE of Glomus versiforme]|uniref:HVO_A0114 family putative DNA-binding protein n=1 Tax=endosymbiont GvMRE of Glomus versiforme TaxID=2039283 RepID=UPI000ECACE82|nr:HTH domain-containing protein [endosymbiont GvMRE of Glomus versiforme]RHZ36928.1 Regulatory protein ArsR [endosymbiont GvMRE of Glomus versiforme]